MRHRATPCNDVVTKPLPEVSSSACTPTLRNCHSCNVLLHHATKEGIMSTRRDRVLIGQLVKKEVESRMSWEVAAKACSVSRATLYRVRDADPRV